MNLHSVPVRSAVALKAMGILLLLAACGSQSDDIGVPSLDDNSVQRSGIFEVDIARGGTVTAWTIMFSETVTTRNPDRVVGYRHDGGESFTGRFAPGQSGQSRRASILWFDQVLVTPEPDPDAEEDDPPPEPVLTRRVRSAVLDINLRARESLTGVISGEVSAAVDGMYIRRRYERVSGFSVLAGVWENIDAAGRELFRLSVDESGGFAAREIGVCDQHTGFIEPINTRYNLYAFELNSTCNEALEDAIGLATITPPPPGSQPWVRPRLVAVVPALDGSDVFFVDVERLSPD